MDYKDLKEIADSKNIEIKDLSSEVEMTPNGFRESIKNETIQLRKLRRVCEILGISPLLFLNNPSGVYLHNVHTQVGDNNQMAIDNKDREIESLREQLNAKDEQLEDKKVIIKMLQEKIEGTSTMNIAATPKHAYKKK